MANSCTALATKSELNALKNQVNSSLNNLNNQKADRGALNNLEVKTASLGGADSFKPNLYLLEVAIAAAVTAINALKPIVFWARDRINDLTEKLNQAVIDLTDLGKGVATNTKDINQLKKDLLEQQRLSISFEYEIKNIKLKANETTAKANEAIDRTNKLLNGLNNNIIKAQNAENQANAAMIQANSAIQGAVTARDTLNQLIVKVDAVNAQAIQSMQQANTAYSIGNIAQQNANLAIAKSEGLSLEINNTKESIKQINGEIELLKIKDLQQTLKNIDIGFELDGLKLTNHNQTDEIERLKTQLATNITSIIDNKIAANNQLIGAGAGGAISTTLEGLQADSVDSKKRIGALESSLTAINAKTNTLEQTQTKQQTQINELDVNSTQKLGGIETALGGIGLAVGAIALQTGQIANQTAPAALATAAETGVCNSTRPGGCMQNALNPIRQGIDNSLTNMAGLGTIAAQNAANTLNILTLLGTIFTYLKDFQSAVTGRFEKLFSHRIVDRALAAFNLALNIHNASMLSADLVQSLGSLLDTIFLSFLKDVDGNGFPVSQIVGQTFQGWIIGLIGAGNYQLVSAQWKRLNRIISATSNLFDSVKAGQQAICQINEQIGGNVAKIGNGLINGGVISENDLKYQDETPQYDGHFTKTQQVLEGMRDATDSLQQIASNVIETQEAYKQIQTNFGELKKEIGLKEKAKTEEEETRSEQSKPKVSISEIDLVEGVL